MKTVARQERQADGADQKVARWSPHPVAAVVLRGLVAVIPIAASLGFVMVVSRLVPAPSDSLYGYLAWWIGLCGASTFVLITIDKASRRCLPLGTLLKLSLVFPDQAPSRFKIALRSGTVTQLQRVVAEAKAGRVGETPAEAAARVLELVAALNAHDRITRGHSERVRAYTQMIAEELGLAAADVDLLHWAGLLHDIGKLEVPYEILNKTSRPTEEEWEILRAHPAAGAALVAPLNAWLGEWGRAVGEHHERWDGDGYPNRLAGLDIAYAARIVSVADVFDVITSARSYKAPIDASAARAEIAACSGTQFDPAVVRAFLNISIGRLRLAMGPLSLVAQSPVGGVSIPPVIGAAVSGLAVGATSVVGSLFAGPTPTPAYAARTAPAIAAKSAPRPVAHAPKVAPTVSSPPESPDGPSSPDFPDQPDSPTVPNREAPTVLAQIDEDTPTVVPLKGLDLVDLESLRITSNPAESASPKPGGAVQVSPPLNFYGTIDFGYEACWSSGCAPGTLVVAVRGIEDPPVVQSEAVTIPEGAFAILDPLANATDPDGDVLSLTTVGAPGTGAAVIAGGGVVYLPPADFAGSDAFAYTVGDGAGLTATAFVTVTVTPVNDPPSFGAGTSQTVLESAGAQSVVGWATGISPGPVDESGQTVSFSVTNDNAALFSVPPAVAADGTLTYTPTVNTFGIATVTVVAVDSGGGADTSAAQTFTITVAPVPPSPQSDAYTVDQDTSLSIAAPGVLANDFDPIGNPLTVQTVPVSAPAHGVVTLGSDGSFVYTPTAGFVGSDSFTYLVDDGAGLTATATVSITVNSGVMPGTFYLGTAGSSATNYALTTTPPPAAVPVPDFDSDGDPGLTLKSSSGAETITDPRRHHRWTYVAPSAVTLDGPVTLQLWSTVKDFDTDKQGNPVVFLYDCAAGGTGCVKLAQGQLRLDPWNTGSSWTEHVITLGSVTHTVSVGRELRVRVLERREDLWVAMTAAYPSRLDVMLANVAPVANPDAYSVLEDAPTTNLPVLANDVDANLDASSVAITVPPTKGTAVVLGDGTIDYTAMPDANGADSFSYQVCDTAGLCSATTISIAIVPVNDAPSFGLSSSFSVSLPLPVSVAGFVNAISTGPADESSQIPSFTLTNDNPGLFAVQPTIAADGTLSFQPTGIPGTATVTVVMTDSGGTANGGVDTSSAQTFLIIVL